MKMQSTDHIDAAQEFLEVADAAFEDGEIFEGWGKLWEAVTHAAMAVAKRKDLSCYDRESRRKAVLLFSQEIGDESLYHSYTAGDMIYYNTHGGYIVSYDYTLDRKIARRFVFRISKLIDEFPDDEEADQV
jgi:hypothetical protein